MTAYTGSHKATQENGPSVIGGKLIWTSASGIGSADTKTFGGCLRKFWYEKVDGRETPTTKAQQIGTDMHKVIEDHLTKGSALTQLATAGRRFIPHPGSGLLVEQPVDFMSSEGVRILGHTDLYNFRGEYIDEEGTLQSDPPWTVQVVDWKSTSDFSYSKTPQELAENVQLTTYAEAAFRKWPDLEHARLTHVSFLTKGRPQAKLVTILRDRSHIAERWEYATSVIRIMADVAKETVAERVPANTKSCGAYRGCPYRSICKAAQQTSLDSLYGKVSKDWNTMGLLSNVMQPPAPPAPDMRAQLNAEEATLRAQQAQVAPPVQAVAPGIPDAWERIRRYNRGLPMLCGNAAQAFAKAMGYQAPPIGAGYAGASAPPGTERPLSHIQLQEPQQFFQLLNELDNEAGAAPPPVPQSFTAQVAQVYQQTVQPTQVVAPPVKTPPSPGHGMTVLAPGAPESMPQLAQAYVAPVQERVTMIVTEAGPVPVVLGDEPIMPVPRKRGRPAKEASKPPEATAATAGVVVAVPPTPAALQVPPVQASTDSPSVRRAEAAASVASVAPAAMPTDAGVILINARAVSLSTKSLAPYVDYINAELAKRYCVSSDGKPGVQDVRCASKDSILAFGGWKGAVREVVKADPPPHGDWHLDTMRDELNEIVADALRVVAEAQGWLYIRGVQS